MAADVRVKGILAHQEARRLEERALNASGAFDSLVYDGWLLGYRRGPSKRLRCVNPFYASSLPLAQKMEYCTAFYRDAGLPAMFRLLPFSRPPELDALLERRGWGRFGHTLVLRAQEVADLSPSAAVAEIIDVPAWLETTAALLALDARALPPMLERARSYPLPHAGAIVRRDGQIVACGLVKLEDGHAGLFALHTASAHRGVGLGRAIVAALLAEAFRRRAHTAYLQVSADNAPALSLYDRCGFTTAYDYGYRACFPEQP